MRVLFLLFISIFFVACGSDSQNNRGDGGSNTLQQPITTSSDTNNSSSQGSNYNQNTTKQDDDSNQTVDQKGNKVLNNMGNPSTKVFNGFVLELRSNKVLSDNLKLSKESVVVFGSINGKKTNALLKINENYRDSNLTLLIYKNNALVYKKENIEFKNQVAVNFGDIVVKE